jgi:hypothetical protein
VRVGDTLKKENKFTALVALRYSMRMSISSAGAALTRYTRDAHEKHIKIEAKA